MMSPRILAVVCATAALGGCMDRDPYRRTDVWRPTGSNAANIAAMVADPNDLIRGRGTSRTSSQPGVTAVDRVVTSQPRPISPAANAGGGGGGGTGSGGGTAAGTGSGAGSAGAGTGTTPGG